MLDQSNSHRFQDPILSVLMPCYNVSETVDEAVRSILRQDMGEWELIAVDDGSSDSTWEHLEAWAEKDHRVRPIRLMHVGIIEALNHGLTDCRAPLIARMDADDRSHRERFSRQVLFLREHPEVAVVGCLVEGFPHTQVREGFRIYLQWLNGLTTPEDIAREIYVESPLAHPSIVMRREWLDRVGGYQDHGWPEDYDLWLRLHLAGASFAKVPEILFYWREHVGRLTRTDRRYSVENFLRAKARYLCRGPLVGRDGVILWGAGQMGRRLSKHLLREVAPLVAFIDIDPAKIGRTRRGLPILAPDALTSWWDRYQRPVVLAAVRSRGARALIRERLQAMGFVEAQDWWAVA